MSTTLIIVILVLVCVLTTPLSLKRLIDRKKPAGTSGASEGASGMPGGLTGSGEHPAGASGASEGAPGTSGGPAGSGEHIPPFLIASITDSRILNCAGCYDRAREAGEACGIETGQQSGRMSPADWDRIFTEAEELGISLIFLVGGESMLCREIIEIAGKHRSILFPIITNGTLIDDSYLQLYDRCDNLLPVISIEGGQASTDARGSAGTYEIPQKQVQRLASLCIPFGVSVTVTTENLREVTSAGFAEDLRAQGCRLMLYIEYVATGEADVSLEPAEADRALMELRLEAIRQANENMVVLVFPGDEKAYGGCALAHRGGDQGAAGRNNGARIRH